MPDTLPHFSWLIPGVLAGMGKPRGPDDLAALHALGVGAVVTLTQEPLPAAWLAGYDITVMHLPVPDFTAPTPAQIREAVGAISAFRAAGLPVVVHCAGGKGRTGTVLACVLVAGGMGAREAIAAVRAARPGSVETAAQAAAIAAYATAAMKR